MQCHGMPIAGMAPRRGIGASARLAETTACRAIKVSLPTVDVDANARLLESWGVVESTPVDRYAAMHEAAHGSAGVGHAAPPVRQLPPARPAHEHANGTNTVFLSHFDAPTGTTGAPKQLASGGMGIDEARKLTARIKVINLSIKVK